MKLYKCDKCECIVLEEFNPIGVYSEGADVQFLADSISDSDPESIKICFMCESCGGFNWIENNKISTYVNIYCEDCLELRCDCGCAIDIEDIYCEACSKILNKEDYDDRHQGFIQ